MIYGLRVFAIGGGTGLSALLAGLKRSVSPSPPRSGEEASDATRESLYFADLAALVTVTDDGGSSGRLRDEFRVLPPGDIRNCLVALSADESLLSSLFQYRFRGNGDLGGHNFGNLFLTALTEVTGDFNEAVRAASQVLAVEGRIFPSTNESVTLVAELDNGEVLRGETRISDADRPIARIRLDPPECAPPADALQALREADLILIGPGSLYTSLIPNLLVPGVAEAIARSDALVVYLCNIMTQPGETDGYDVVRHAAAILEHCPALRISYVLANDKEVPASTLLRYHDEGAEPVMVGQESALPCPLESEDLLQSGSVVRHDGVKAAKALLSLFHRARLGRPIS